MTVCGPNRRTLLHYAAGFAVSGAGLEMLSSACRLLPGQNAAKVPRIGYLSVGPREVYAARSDAFLEGVRALGYVEGETVSIEWRFSPAGNSDAPWLKLVMELIERQVDVIVVQTTAQPRWPPRRLSPRIPIVAVPVTYLVESGLGDSLARPGGNLTALASLAP